MNIQVRLWFVLSCIINAILAAGDKFYSTKHDRRYIGQEPLKIVSVSSITKCQILCQTTSNCTASNYGPVNSTENGKHACELLNVDFNNDDTLEHSHGWFYIGEYFIYFLSMFNLFDSMYT